MKTDIRIEWIENDDGLDSYEEAWDRLALASKQRLPMLSASWIRSYFESMLTPSERWACALAFAGDELVGVLPVVFNRVSLPGRDAPSLRTPFDFDLHTRTGDAVAKPGQEKAILPVLLNAVLKRDPHWLRFAMRGVSEESPTLSVLGERFPDARVIKSHGGYGSFLPIAGSFEEYRSGLSPNFRGNLRKARNKLLKLGGDEISCLAGREATGSEFDTFLRLEASGWKGRAGTALLMNPDLVKFYTALVRRLSRRGWLEWHFLKVDGRPVAVHLAVRMRRTLVLLKIAYEESFSHCAPGNQLFLGIVERAYRAGDTGRIDCLTDMAWHGNWRMNRKIYVHLHLYPRRLFPFLLLFIPHRTYNNLRNVPGIQAMVNAFRARMQAAASGKGCREDRPDGRT